jgi:hypothetical protein
VENGGFSTGLEGLRVYHKNLPSRKVLKDAIIWKPRKGEIYCFDKAYVAGKEWETFERRYAYSLLGTTFEKKLPHGEVLKGRNLLLLVKVYLEK